MPLLLLLDEDAPELEEPDPVDDELEDELELELFERYSMASLARTAFAAL